MSYVNYNSKKVLKKLCFLGPVILQPFLGGKVWRRKITLSGGPSPVFWLRAQALFFKKVVTFFKRGKHIVS